MFSVMELKTIECVSFFYNEGAKGEDFIQKNKFRCSLMTSFIAKIINEMIAGLAGKSVANKLIERGLSYYFLSHLVNLLHWTRQLKRLV